MSCRGLHCSGCGRGGAGLAGAVVLIVIGAACWHVLTAPSTARAIGTGLAVAAVIVGSLLGLAVLAAIVAAGLAIRRSVRSRAERAAMTYRAEPVAGPGREYPPLRLVSTRALPERGRAALSGRPAYRAQEPAGARLRRGRVHRP